MKEKISLLSVLPILTFIAVICVIVTLSCFFGTNCKSGIISDSLLVREMSNVVIIDVPINEVQCTIDSIVQDMMITERICAYNIEMIDPIYETPDYEMFYHYSCAPYNVRDRFDNTYDIIWDKSYKAVYGGEIGFIDVTSNDFGTKLIGGMVYNYQYGIIFKLEIENEYIYPMMVIIFVEPLDTMMVRIKLIPCGMTTRYATWLSESDKLTFGYDKPSVYFECDDTSNMQCEYGLDVFVNSAGLDLNGADILEIEFICGKLYVSKYDLNDDLISGQLILQLSYCGYYFTQVWDFVLENE